jgi:hypothetical protein
VVGGKADVGSTAGFNLFVALGLCSDRRREPLTQHLECPDAQADQQVVLVLEIDVDEGARQTSLAGDLLHRHGFETHDSSNFRRGL